MLVVAHRGARASAPENTIAAFTAAVEAGVEAIEFDVLATADGVPVVVHDDRLDRVAGVAERVSRTGFAQIRRLDVSASLPGWPQPETIPTLEEVVRGFAGRVRLYVELKAVLDEDGFRSSAVAAEAAWPVLDGVPDVVVSSFDPAGPLLIRGRDRTIPIGLGVAHAAQDLAFAEEAGRAGFDEIHLEDAIATREAIEAATTHGLRTLVWTVDDAARARELSDWGAAGIFSDDPAAMRASLR